MLLPTKQLGNDGEAAVVKFLQQRGFSILERNYQIKLGEVDIIAHKGEVFAFVEVKTRKIAYFPIAQTVTLRKQQCIIKSKDYILKHSLCDAVFRFDVATVVYDEVGYQIEYIENAFNKRY